MNETQNGRICVSIGQKDVESALAAAREAEAHADVIEIRLDTLIDPQISPFFKTLQKPLLFTCRPVWEGGYYDGVESSRIDLLHEAVSGGAAYIDLELLSPDDSFMSLSQVVKGSDTKLIVSSHNFSETPSRGELLDILLGMKNRDADIGKLVTTAHDHRDVLRVLQLQLDAEEMDLPLAAFCMGRAGVISRLATIALGGFMTYCAPNELEATAPGQIPAGVMRRVIDSLYPDGGKIVCK